MSMSIHPTSRRQPLSFITPPVFTAAMPIIRDFAVPKSPNALIFPPSATDVFFIAFLASEDPQTKKPWCPDVVAALPTLVSVFTGAKKPVAAFVEVGQRPEYAWPL